MKSTTLLDNWTLQDAFEFLAGKLDGSAYPRLKYSANAEIFEWERVSRDLARFEGFCQLIKHIVLTDEVWVDKDNMQSWSTSSSAAPLRGAGIIVGRAFQAAKTEWLPLRQDIEKRLCWNENLSEQYEANKRAFVSQSGDVDNRLSTLIWGGAGMLARATYSGVMYESHCLRADLFRKSGFLPGPDGAQDHIQSFVKAKRLQLFTKIDRSGFLGRLSLPPVVSLVISRASSRDELLPAALEVREEFRELRGWLGRWQDALSCENLELLLEYEKMLEEISSYIDGLASSRATGDTTVQVGVSWLKVSTKADSPVNKLKNKYGVRAELNRLVLSPTGQQSARKLVSLISDPRLHTAAKLAGDIIAGIRISQ